MREGSKKGFALKAGYMEGQVMDVDAVSAIAKLPDREGMLSMFAGALTSTLSGLAVAMQAYVDKQGRTSGIISAAPKHKTTLK